jgi:hypothetical protein
MGRDAVTAKFIAGRFQLPSDDGAITTDVDFVGADGDLRGSDRRIARHIDDHVARCPGTIH